MEDDSQDAILREGTRGIPEHPHLAMNAEEDWYGEL
jgi:hypothetical protein